MPLRLHDRPADLTQLHFRNIAGGDAEGIDRGRGVKFKDMGKLVRCEIIVCPQAKTREQHIGHADLQCLTVEHLQIEVVQLLQQTILAAVAKILQVVRDVVRHGIVAGGAYGVCKVSFLGQTAKAGLQRFDNCGCKLRPHRPDGQRAR